MAKKKILIIDDEKDLVETVIVQLEKGGYEFITAYNGADGLKKAHEETPDLIILDLKMPEMSGFDVCLKLKTDEKYKKIPVIILSAKFQPNDITFANDLGADGYITKPFEREVLFGKVKELLRK